MPTKSKPPNLVPFNCKQTKCPLFKNKQCISTEIKIPPFHERVDTFIIGSAPGELEIQHGRPFVDLPGQLLYRILKNQYDRYNLWQTNSLMLSTVVRCRPTKIVEGKVRNRTPTTTEIGFCIRHTIREIHKYHPRTIMLLGTTAYQSIISKLKISRPINTIHKERGVTFWADIDGYETQFVVAYDPAFVQHKQYEIQADPRNSDLFIPLHQLFNDTLIGLNVLKPMKKIPKAIKIHEIKTIPQLKKLVNHYINDLDENACIALDTETASLKRIANYVTTIQFCADGKNAYVIPYEYPDTWDKAERRQVRKLLRKLFVSKKAKFKYWIMHNAKFDETQILRDFGVILTKPTICTLAYSRMLDENSRQHDLKSLVMTYLNYHGYEKEALEQRAEGNLFALATQKFFKYAATDAYVTWWLFYWFRTHYAPDVDGRGDIIEKFVATWNSRINKMIAIMEYNGMWIDREKLDKLINGDDALFNAKLNELETNLQKRSSVRRARELLTANIRESYYDVWDEEATSLIKFDSGKPDHLRTLMFNILQLKPVSLSAKTQKPKIDKEFYGAYAKKYKEVALLKEMVELKKLRSAYAEDLWKRLHEDPDCTVDGRVRPSFQSDTVTGRLSCNNPNMQTIPHTHSGFPGMIRELFAAPPGYALIQADFSANEVRVFGEVSRDPELLGIFSEAKKYLKKYRKTGNKKWYIKWKEVSDFHRKNASIAYGLALNEVTSEMRTKFKPVIFGLLYGKGIATLAKDMKLSEEEAKERIERIMGLYKKGDKWLKAAPVFAEEHLYIDSPHGRRRHLRGFLYNENSISARERRQSANFVIQGLASDLAMMSIAEFVLQECYYANRPWLICNVVHDSIYLQVPINDVKEAVKLMEPYLLSSARKIFGEEMGVEIKIDLGVDFEVGTNLNDMQSWDFDYASLDTMIANLKTREKKAT